MATPHVLGTQLMAVRPVRLASAVGSGLSQLLRLRLEASALTPLRPDNYRRHTGRPRRRAAALPPPPHSVSQFTRDRRTPRVLRTSVENGRRSALARGPCQVPGACHAPAASCPSPRPDRVPPALPCPRGRRRVVRAAVSAAAFPSFPKTAGGGVSTPLPPDPLHVVFLLLLSGVTAPRGTQSSSFPASAPASVRQSPSARPGKQELGRKGGGRRDEKRHLGRLSSALC